jgi:hypothetical protein
MHAATDPHTSAAQNAPGGMILEVGMSFLFQGIFDKVREFPPVEADLQKFRHLLKRAVFVRATAGTFNPVVG